MSIKFKPSKRSGTHLLLGLAGPSGAGKTLSALRIARGLASDDSKIFVIDTEAGRALHYACADGEKPGKFTFAFQHGELEAPFSPMAYGEALKVAVDAGAEVIIVDSASHEHEGPGGILEMHVEEHKRLGNRDATKFAAWIKPKHAHDIYVNSLLQTKAHLIFCFRAKDKMAMIKNKAGKMEPTKLGWTAIITDRMEFEMSDLLMLPPGCDGVPDLTKGKILEHHRTIFGELPAGRDARWQGFQLSEQTGEKLAAWAAGGETPSVDEPPDDEPSEAFDKFEDLLSRDMSKKELEKIGAKIKAKASELSAPQTASLKKLYGAKLKELSEPRWEDS